MGWLVSIIGKIYTLVGTEITDRVSHSLLKFLNLPIIPENVMVRGELVISKEKFEKYKNDFATSRSFVSGIVNSENPPERAKEIEFVAHELISELPVSISEQFKKLRGLGFAVVKHATIKSLNVKILDKALDLIEQSRDLKSMGLLLSKILMFINDHLLEILNTRLLSKRTHFF